MNAELVSLLKANIGVPLSPDLAASICVAAGKMETLVPAFEISRVRPERDGRHVFSLERIETIAHEIKPLHQAHWKETEAHRHAFTFNPDYPTFIRYERAGRYVLLTVRLDGRLVGNCAMYLDRSTHTHTVIATEDTLYLLPEARKGQVARRFVAYIERVMRQLGAREIHITVKTVNKAARFFQMLGYRHVENGLMKILEVDNV